MNTDLDLGMCDKLLTTTRSIRKRLDLARPVPPELIEECLEVALQSPSATNTQKWRFVVIRDADKRAGIARLYKHAFESYWEQADEATYGTTGPASTEAQRMIDSAAYLVNHLHEVPVQVLFCIEDHGSATFRFSIRPQPMAQFCRRPGRLCWPPARGVLAAVGPQFISNMQTKQPSCSIFPIA